jgi:hypothetical protein
MQASVVAFPVPMVALVILVVSDGLLQVCARERRMRNKSNSKKREKGVRRGGRHREQGERRRLLMISASFRAGADGDAKQRQRGGA